MWLLAFMQWTSHLYRNHLCQKEAISSANSYLLPKFKRTQSEKKTSGYVSKSLHSPRLPTPPASNFWSLQNRRERSIITLNRMRHGFISTAKDPKLLFFLVIFRYPCLYSIWNISILSHIPSGKTCTFSDDN